MLTVFKYPLSLKNLWHSVIGKHCELIDIREGANTLAFELAIDISDKNLCSFVEVYLMSFINTVVLKVREVLGEHSEQLHC